MTDDDKQIVANYMNWPNEYGNRRSYDLNDAGLCVQEIQKRGDIFDFYSYLIDIYNELVEQGTVICGADNFTAWFFIPENFFGAMAVWIKDGKK